MQEQIVPRSSDHDENWSVRCPLQFNRHESNTADPYDISDALKLIHLLRHIAFGQFGDSAWVSWVGSCYSIKPHNLVSEYH